MLVKAHRSRTGLKRSRKRPGFYDLFILKRQCIDRLQLMWLLFREGLAAYNIFRSTHPDFDITVNIFVWNTLIPMTL